MKPVLTVDRLRELLDYDPAIGVFRWRTRHSRQRTPGQIAGGVNQKGYARISIDGMYHQSHRLAWLHFYGEWPALIIDHINRNKTDNRIANLRLATISQNAANSLGRKGKDPTQPKGITFVPKNKKWQAQIYKDGRRFYLGLYSSPEEAHDAYAGAAVDLFAQFAFCVIGTLR